MSNVTKGSVRLPDADFFWIIYSLITETVPKVVGTQIHRSNTPAESVSDYYKRTITIPLLDHLMCDLDYRFNSSKTEAIFNGFVIVPAKLIAIVQQPEKGH